MSAEERAHSPIGASAAYRWTKCPGSVRYTAGLENQAGEAAEEGTRAHGLAEDCLRAGIYDLTHATDHELYEPYRAEAVQVYLDHLLDLQLEHGAEHFGIEERIVLDHIDEEAFGTADFWMVSEAERTLFVRDYKHGENVVVEAEGNLQLLYYGLGVLRRIHNLGLEIDHLDMGIVQPRAWHKDGPIRVWRLDMSELELHEAELEAAIRATRAPDAPLVAGGHCKFCPAAGFCPAVEKTVDGLIGAARVQLPSMEKATEPDTAALADLLEKAVVARNWLNRLDEYAHRRAESGDRIPGFKLVKKRAYRKWKDEDDAAAVLRREFGDDKVLTLKSPNAIEQTVGKAKAVRAVVDPLVEKVSNGTKVVPESDPGEPVAAKVSNAFSVVDE